MSIPSLQDDASIPGQAALWRRITPDWLIWDKNLNAVRPTSQAFDNVEMSVVLGDDLLAAGRAAAEIVAGYPDFAVASITAQLARDKQQAVCRDPTAFEPQHGLVVGNKTGGVRKAFSRNATWVIPPSESVVARLRPPEPDTASP